jgi:predicted secreted Zn-dependent protease
MLLPRWNPPAGTNPELLRTWKRFSDVLREHEDGHHRIAKSAAQEVRRKLTRSGKARDCRALEANMTAAANRVLSEYREKQAEFDRKTDYGRAQGARLL